METTTPNEIRNQQFSTSMRGYNKDEVENFKQNAAAALEGTRTQLVELNDKATALEARYAEIKKLEEAIKTAVVEAQKTGEQIVATARKEGELLIREAKQRRDKVISDMHDKISALETKIHDLEYTKKSLYSKMRSEIASHLKLVDSIGAETVEPTPTSQAPQPTQKPRTRQTVYQEKSETEKSIPTTPPEQPRPEPPTGEVPTEPYRDEIPPEPVDQKPTQKKEPAPESDRPKFDIKNEDIDRIVDQFGEVSQEEEEVTHGKPQGNG